MLNRALTTDSDLKQLKINVEEKEAMFRYSGGDARKLLNIIDIVVGAQSGKPEIVINNKIVEDILQENLSVYDKNGEMHYDIISAFIKSIRGSDPNGAVIGLRGCSMVAKM